MKRITKIICTAAALGMLQPCSVSAVTPDLNSDGMINAQDAAAGDKFTIDYCPQEYVTHLWNDTISGNRYVDLGEVSWENGSISITAGGKGEMMGDVNCDDTVNILDVLALNRNFLIGEKLTEAGTLNADVDGDGKPTSIDALMILKYTIHLIEAL